MEHLTLYFLLGLVGFVAGFVDAVSGGGGLVALPALMTTGLPPNIVIGTLKLQSLFGTVSATYGYFGRDSLKHLRENKWAFGFTAIGAIAGTYLLNLISPDILMVVVPFLLLGVSCFVLFSNPLAKAENAKDVPVNKTHQSVFGALWGGYDGFFGPGTGMFWTISLVRVAKQPLIKAVGLTKLMNVCSNVVSVSVFLTLGAVHFGFAITMGVGQILGSLAGAKMGKRFQSKLIKPMVVLFSVALSVKLIIDIFS